MKRISQLQHVATDFEDRPRYVFAHRNPADLVGPNRRLRRRSTRGKAKLKHSIERYDVVTPVIIDRTGRILDGVDRVEIARELQHETIPVVIVDGQSDADLRALQLALNRLPDDAEWDQEALAEALSTIIEIDSTFDLSFTGFEIAQIDLMLDEASERGQVDTIDEDLPEHPSIAASCLGDIFDLGDHSIVCGDIRHPETLSHLSSGRLFDAVVTDPPFNVRIDGHATGAGGIRHREFPMASGEMSSAEYRAFLQASIGRVAQFCRDGALIYSFIDWRHAFDLETAARALGLTLINLCVWNKSNAGMGSFYRSQHELVLVYRKGDRPHRNNIELGRHGRNRTNVWSYDGVNTLKRERRAELALHPTVKPVAMIEDALKDCTKPGDRVLDGFLGSGTTLLAAERSRRVCHGVELDPGYVDVAIERWQALTGRAAIHRESGLTFRQLRARRLRRHLRQWSEQ